MKTYLLVYILLIMCSLGTNCQEDGLIKGFFHFLGFQSHDETSNVAEAGDNHAPNPRSQNCSISTPLSNRIVNGEDAIPYEFPWLASVQLFIKGKPAHNCGGSIVSKQFILTAAHCVEDIPTRAFFIQVGKYQLYKVEAHEQNRTVINVFTKGYNSQNFKNDIALLQLNESLSFNDYVYPACLPETGETFTGTAVIAGWGRLKEKGAVPDKLQKAVVPLTDPDKCNNILTDQGYDKYLHSCQICALSNELKDTCQGDSGGPLMCFTDNNAEYRLCGVVSWGVGCARSNEPGVYTKVACFVKWIQDTIEANEK